jgi:hypothetical protein
MRSSMSIEALSLTEDEVEALEVLNLGRPYLESWTDEGTPESGPMGGTEFGYRHQGAEVRLGRDGSVFLERELDGPARCVHNSGTWFGSNVSRAIAAFLREQRMVAERSRPDGSSGLAWLRDRGGYGRKMAAQLKRVHEEEQAPEEYGPDERELDRQDAEAERESMEAEGRREQRARAEQALSFVAPDLRERIVHRAIESGPVIEVALGGDHVYVVFESGEGEAFGRERS